MQKETQTYLKVLTSPDSSLQVIVQMDQQISIQSYGKAFKAYNRNNPKQYYTIKMIPQDDQTLKMLTKHQLKMSQSVKNSIHIISYLPTLYYSDNVQYLISEYYEYSLQSDLNINKKFSQQEIFRIFTSLMIAYKSLYENKILHQNITPKNILKTKLGYKLGGLQHSVFYQTHTFTQIKIGNICYMPPEKLVMKIQKGDHKSDIYSLGIIFYQLLFQEHPYIEFQKLNQIQIKDLVNILKQNNNIKQTMPDCSIQLKKLYDIIVKMISKSSLKRIIFQDIWKYLVQTQYYKRIIQQPEQNTNIESITQSPLSKQVQEISVPQLNHKKQQQQKQQQQNKQQQQKIINKIHQYLFPKQSIVSLINIVIKDLLQRQIIKQNKKQKQSLIHLLFFSHYLTMSVISEMVTPTIFKQEQWLLFSNSHHLDLVKKVVQENQYIQFLIAQIYTTTQFYTIAPQYQDKNLERRIKMLHQSLLLMLININHIIKALKKQNLTIILRTFQIVNILENYVEFKGSEQSFDYSDKTLDQLMQIINTKCQQRNISCVFEIEDQQQ